MRMSVQNAWNMGLIMFVHYIMFKFYSPEANIKQ